MLSLLFETKGGILYHVPFDAPSDWAEVLALWQAQRGDTEEFVRGAVERFAGVQNVYVAEEKRPH